ncbi:MAG: DUF296 domain-containing protein [Thermoplasmataceae archaeon]
MQIAREGSTIFLKMDAGENVRDTILDVVKKENITSGEITWGIGRIRSLEVGYLKGRNYEKVTFNELMEIVSFHGSIAANDPILHIHCSGAGSDYRISGGHFFNGIADPLMEVSIRIFTSITMGRVENKKSGIMELNLVRS